MVVSPPCGLEPSPHGEGPRLHDELDAAFAAEMDGTTPGDPDSARPKPQQITENEAVQIAYRHELQQIAKFLKHGLSVLILCDKILTEHIYKYVCSMAGKQPVLVDEQPPPPPETPGNRRAAFDQGQSGPAAGLDQLLTDKLRDLKVGEILVLRSVDLLDSPPLIEILYRVTGRGQRPQLLGFLDPSLEAKKVLTDRFAVHAGIMGLPRYIQPDPNAGRVHTVTRLITAQEQDCFASLDAEGLYKNVAGLNAIQFRSAMQYVGATVAPHSEPRVIYDEIRNFKRSSSGEIEIPDIGFDDIGGYEHVKQELMRIITLVTGGLVGMDEAQREKLIPRGFIFHGPPGTGKTLFAKAIANAMNATIQMVSGPEIMDKYVGQSESNLRQIFATARRNAPSVIFFDEFDSIASQRSTYADGGARVNNAVVAQLLTELDGFREGQSVLLIGTTNRLDIIDEALLRPSRLKPIEIKLPDYTARRSVAAIHAGKFGVDRLLRDLCRLAQRHLGGWRTEDSVPQPLLDDLFKLHEPFRRRCQAETDRMDFARGLVGFRDLLNQEPADGNGVAPAQQPSLKPLVQRLHQIAQRLGLDLDQPQPPADDHAAWRLPIHADLDDLLRLLQSDGPTSGRLSPDGFLDGVLDLIAEYTDGFNNDEIRAVFQEASLEYHMEAQLVTPRYLGLKIGLIRKRRDERQVTHLGDDRQRH